MSKSFVKEMLLKEIKNDLTDAESLIIARYGKLEGAKSWELRNELHKVGGKLKVSKKGIFAKAALECKVPYNDKMGEGNVGIAFVHSEHKEPMEALKRVFNYSKANPDDKFQVICALIDGEWMEGAAAKELSSLPTLDVLRAHFIALLVAPMAQTLSVMQAAIDGPLAEPLAASEKTTQTE